jgi:hypothetical protein
MGSLARADHRAPPPFHRHDPGLPRPPGDLGDHPAGPQLYPASALIDRYARRWRLELCLRDLKTTMGMEELRCKTPDMAEKELLAYLVAHNRIRCVIAEAVARYAVDLERVSFKGSGDALRQYSEAIGKARNRKMRRQLWEDLLWNLARDLVSAPAPSSGTAGGQAPAQALPFAQSTTPPLQGNPPPQPLLERTPPQLSKP